MLTDWDCAMLVHAWRDYFSSCVLLFLVVWVALLCTVLLCSALLCTPRCCAVLQPLAWLYFFVSVMRNVAMALSIPFMKHCGMDRSPVADQYCKDPARAVASMYSG